MVRLQRLINRDSSSTRTTHQPGSPILGLGPEPRRPTDYCQRRARTVVRFHDPGVPLLGRPSWIPSFVALALLRLLWWGFSESQLVHHDWQDDSGKQTVRALADPRRCDAISCTGVL